MINRVVCVAAAMIFPLGCGSGVQHRQFDPRLPVDLAGYTQEGQPIDPKSLEAGLEKDPLAGPHMRRAQATALTSTVMAYTGGALIGWPLGASLGGETNPPWALAYVGGLVIVGAFGFGFWSVSSFEDAVRAHNDSLPAGTVSWEGTSLKYTW